MKPQTVTKLNNLLNMGLPKTHHEDKVHHDIIEYVTPGHVTGVVVITGSGDDHKRFDGEHEVDTLVVRSVIVKAKNEFKRSKFNRKDLVEILTNMDSEFVTLYMDEGTPVLIEGKTEDNIVKGVTAPVIGDEEE